ncbi:MAG: tRNA (adenosine(37)-N6)-dimethylallyltransferase MiaA, partial [Gaiellaceae bacterium]
MTNQVLAIFGPTASGKTAVAEELVERTPAEVVSADSMQVYRGLPILTAQPERPTRLVGIWDLDHEASVGEYQRLAHQAIDEVLAAGKIPVVAGGSGLYLRAALSDIEIPPLVVRGAREEWERFYDRLGPDEAHQLLVERDPAAAARVHPNDRRRVVRALELHSAGSSLAPGRDELWSEETRHPTLVFGLDLPREILVKRIKARAREMFEHGVEEEVRRALERPISMTARQMHGLDVIASLPRAEAFEELVRRTRSYAYYQRKWMRRIPGLVSLPANRPPGEIADAILEVARAR